MKMLSIYVLLAVLVFDTMGNLSGASSLEDNFKRGYAIGSTYGRYRPVSNAVNSTLQALQARDAMIMDMVIQGIAQKQAYRQ